MKGGKVANAASTWGGAFWQGHQRITARQQIQARRVLCAAPVLPYSGCRGEGKGRLKSLAPVAGLHQPLNNLRLKGRSNEMHAAILRQFAVSTRGPETVAALSPRGQPLAAQSGRRESASVLYGRVAATGGHPGPHSGSVAPPGRPVPWPARCHTYCPP